MFLKKRAFSLVELMVVIAIIGILSAIAIPSYKKYVIKSTIASAIPIGSAALDAIAQSFNINDSFPSTVPIYGGLTNFSYTAINTPTIIGLWYWPRTTPVQSADICMFFSSALNIPGYIASSGGNNGTANRICMNIRFTNNTYIKSCGIWGQGETMDIPVEYLPTGCNCDNVKNSAYGTPSC